MSKFWKGTCVIALLMALVAFGMSLSLLIWAREAPIARGDEQIYVDLSKLMLRYDDPMRGMAGDITYRRVFQDALWYQINNPQVSEETRVECFAIVGLMHENRGTEITGAQYEILMDAVQRVWGPAIVAILEEELR